MIINSQRIYIVTCLSHPAHVSSSVPKAVAYAQAHQRLWGLSEDDYMILVRVIDADDISTLERGELSTQPQVGV